MLMLPYGQFSAHMPQPMHQSSMMISRDSRRRIEPTGQPTMQYGSRHDRHELATRNLSNRSPSRISRVTPSCVSAQALVHSSHRVHFSRSSTSRLWAFISPCPRNAPSEPCSTALSVSRSRCSACIAPRRAAAATVGELVEDVAEVGRGDPDEVDVVERRAGRRADARRGEGADLGEVRQQTDLAEVAARPDVVQDMLAAGTFLRHLHEPGPHQVEAVDGRRTLAETE